jgi:hypothetical protein
MRGNEPASAQTPAEKPSRDQFKSQARGVKVKDIFQCLHWGCLPIDNQKRFGSDKKQQHIALCTTEIA